MADLKDRIADVIVIGGGIHGCSTALHLARGGMSVTVVEKDYIGRHASGVNAGGVRRLGRHFSEVPLAMASAKMWQEITQWVDDDCGFVSSCQIKVAETELQFTQLEARASQLRMLGFTHEQIIDRQALRQRLPAVSEHCVGGMIVEGDGSANPFRTVQAFRNKARQLGVVFKTGMEVEDILRHSDIWSIKTKCGERLESPYLVNCAGAWGGRISAMLEEPVPIEARAPMLMITARMPHFIVPVVSSQGRTLSFKQFQNGTVMIGGGHEGQAVPQSNETRLDYAELGANARTAADIFPLIRHARIVRCWAGIEGMMPDRIPVISRSKHQGAVHGFGFSAHGFQLGPIGGKILSELILDGESKLPISDFRIDRFADTSVTKDN